MRRLDRRPPPASIYALILRRSAGLQATVILSALFMPPLAVAPLEIQRRIIDEAIPNGDLDLLSLLAVAYLAALLTLSLLKFAIYYLRGLIAAKITRYLRQQIVDIQRRRDKTAAHGAVGPVTAIVAEEAYPLGGFAAQAINTPLVEGAALIGVGGFMLYAEPLLALVAVITLATQALVTVGLQTRINRMSARRVRAVRRASRDIVEASERSGAFVFRDALRELRLAFRLRLRMNVFKAALKAFLKFTDKLAILAVLVVGGAMVMRGQTTLGVLVAFISGLKQIGQPWDELLSFYRSFADALVKYNLLRQAQQPSMTLKPDTDPGPAIALP